jgi:hypothetical protein
MPLLQVIAHALILITLAWRSAGRLTASLTYRICAAYLFVWCNLAYTALMLSVFSLLDDISLYFWISVFLAGGLEVLLHAFGVTPIARKSDAPPDRFDRLVTAALGGVFALMTLATLLICVHFAPNNWDTITYRLSRAFFYLARGNLLHAGNTADPRLSYYPFNGVLLYLFLSIYQFPARWFNIIPMLSWSVAGIATFSTARVIGASRTGSLIAAWICLMSPGILVQAASGNDEVLAAGSILIALNFAWEWVISGRRRYVLLAGIGAGLGFGAKLHWGFYWLFICCAAVVFAISLVPRQDLRAQLPARAPAAIAAGAIALPLISAFAVCNYASSRQITDADFNKQVLNTPFRISLAREKLRTGTAEMLLGPIPDLVPPVDKPKRERAYAAFNEFFMKCCFSDLVETTKRSPEGYKFQGPADANGYQPAEITIWLGFLPHFLILIAVAQVFVRKLPLACIALIAGFFFWHFTYTAETRYIFWVCTYYSFPAVLAIAAVGPAWDFARQHRSLAARLLLGAFVALFITHTILDANFLVFGYLRNIGFLWHKGPDPFAYHTVEPRVVDAIQSSQRIYIAQTHWEVLYWNFMRFHPGAKYTSGTDLHLPSPDTMMLLTVVPRIASGLAPARLPAGAVAGLVYLGEADGEHIFAQGSGIDERVKDPGRYTLVQVEWRRNASGAITGASSVRCCVGLAPTDGVSLRHEPQGTWLSPGQQDAGSPPQLEDAHDFVLETRDAKHPDQIVRTVYSLDQETYAMSDLVK